MLGYATAQFGKNHLGDRNEFLPTMHGFDEWFGNLYHLNAEEEPEELDYPRQKNPEYTKKYGPRGVLHAWATDKDDPTTDPKFGRVGKQKIKDTGPLTRKRMETIDAEVLGHTLNWLDRNGRGKQPFFCWFNTTACHIWSHSPKKYIQMAVDEGRAEEDIYRAKMLEHDEQVGKLLKKLKQTTLTRVQLGQMTVQDAIKGGEIKVEGRREAISELFGMLDDFKFWFDIVTP